LSCSWVFLFSFQTNMVAAKKLRLRKITYRSRQGMNSPLLPLCLRRRHRLRRLTTIRPSVN